MTPTQRSLKHARTVGYTAAVVEHWNSFVKIRQDLFGWIDILAVRAGSPGVLGIQTTTGAHAAERVTKAIGNKALQVWLEASNRLEVWSWTKHKRKLRSGGYGKGFQFDLTIRAVTALDLAGLPELAACSAKLSARDLVALERLSATIPDPVVEEDEGL